MAYTVTEQELAAAFTEWDRRYREEPERFMSEAAHLLKEDAETYGEACAPYLLSIVKERRIRAEMALLTEKLLRIGRKNIGPVW